MAREDNQSVYWKRLMCINWGVIIFVRTSDSLSPSLHTGLNLKHKKKKNFSQSKYGDLRNHNSILTVFIYIKSRE